jgi:hypothetical protein
MLCFMKNAFLFLLLLPFARLQAQTPETRISPDLSEVTVYFSGAEFKHHAELNLPAGQREVRVGGISGFIEPRSLQVEVNNNAELVAANLVTVSAPKGVTLLTDSLTQLETELRNVGAELYAAREEQNYLTANRKIPDGLQTGWTSELQKGADFLRNRNRENNLRLTELELKQTRLSGRLQGLRQRTGGRRLATGEVQEVALRIKLEKPGTVRLQVSYLTLGSQWEPHLSLRVPEVTKEMKLQALSEAIVYNNSDLNWDNVKLTLKTANPQINASRPDLQPWTLEYAGGNFAEGRLDKYAVKGSRGRQSDSSEVAVAELSSRFNIPGKVSIRRSSDFQVRLAEQMLPMRMEYLTVPKLDQDAFLVAKITDWQQLNIVVQQATVYYRGAYIGETEIAARAYNDTLEVSLGRDNQIMVSRTKKEDFNSKSFIGNSRKTKLTYEINVKNNHSVPIRIRVLDQIPVSQEKEIEVKDVEITGAQLEPTSGKLTWILNLPPSESRKLPFGFTIEYPKNKSVNLHRSRRVSSPKFR